MASPPTGSESPPRCQLPSLKSPKQKVQRRHTEPPSPKASGKTSKRGGTAPPRLQNQTSKTVDEEDEPDPVPDPWPEPEPEPSPKKPAKKAGKKANKVTKPRKEPTRRSGRVTQKSFIAKEAEKNKDAEREHNYIASRRGKKTIAPSKSEIAKMYQQRVLAFETELEKSDAAKAKAKAKGTKRAREEDEEDDDDDEYKPPKSKSKKREIKRPSIPAIESHGGAAAGAEPLILGLRGGAPKKANTGRRGKATKKGRATTVTTITSTRTRPSRRGVNPRPRSSTLPTQTTITTNTATRHPRPRRPPGLANPSDAGSRYRIRPGGPRPVNPLRRNTRLQTGHLPPPIDRLGVVAQPNTVVDENGVMGVPVPAPAPQPARPQPPPPAPQPAPGPTHTLWLVLPHVPATTEIPRRNRIARMSGGCNVHH